MAVDCEGGEFGMLEDIVATGIWRQIKQINIEYHFFKHHMQFWLRHGSSVSKFLQKTSFVQVKHDLLYHPTLDTNLGDLKDGQSSVAIVHYINKSFLTKSKWYLPYSPTLKLTINGPISHYKIRSISLEY